MIKMIINIVMGKKISMRILRRVLRICQDTVKISNSKIGSNNFGEYWKFSVFILPFLTTSETDWRTLNQKLCILYSVILKLWTKVDKRCAIQRWRLQLGYLSQYFEVHLFENIWIKAAFFYIDKYFKISRLADYTEMYG